jgi:hypothetical protein
MDDFQFTTHLDEHNRIAVPVEVARRIPPHASVSVHVYVQDRNIRKGNGALKYYMEHPIEMPGILPFDRDSLYSDKN